MRIVLKKLDLEDSEFILKLVNSPQWLTYIGERHIKTLQDASDFIQRIMENLSVSYQTIRLVEKNIPIGLITLIKRDYLTHYDLGFALLPEYTKHGYASEAAKTVLNELSESHLYPKIQAITTPNNQNSIQLLEKLGFSLETTTNASGDLLWVYGLCL